MDRITPTHLNTDAAALTAATTYSWDGSSAVEQRTVSPQCVGSNPSRPADKRK